LLLLAGWLATKHMQEEHSSNWLELGSQMPASAQQQQ
jgi:hypothetical protein